MTEYMSKPFTFKFLNEEEKKMAKEVADHYGHNLSSLIRWLLKKAWEEVQILKSKI